MYIENISLGRRLLPCLMTLDGKIVIVLLMIKQVKQLRLAMIWKFL